MRNPVYTKEKKVYERGVVRGWTAPFGTGHERRLRLPLALTEIFFSAKVVYR